MVLRMIKKPTEEPQPSPGLMFNNMTHNPALLSNLQILVLMVVLIAACYPAIVYVEGKGPNSFILGTLPSAVAAYFVVPILDFIQNQNSTPSFYEVYTLFDTVQYLLNVYCLFAIYSMYL